MEAVLEQEADDLFTMGDEVVHQAAPDTPLRHTRRLSDKLLVAFHHACDTSDLEVAKRLLDLLELMLVRRPIYADRDRRRNVEGLVAAHKRLWHLQRPAIDQ